MFATETWRVNYKARTYWFRILLAFQIWYGKLDLQLEFGNDLTLHLLLKITSKSYFEFAFDFSSIKSGNDIALSLSTFCCLISIWQYSAKQHHRWLKSLLHINQLIHRLALNVINSLNLFIFKSYSCSFIVLFNFLVIIVIICQTPRQMVILFSV